MVKKHEEQRFPISAVVGCRYRKGLARGIIERCMNKEGVILFYDKSDPTQPFASIHQDGLWWRSADKVGAFIPGAYDLYIYDVKS